MAIAGSQVTVTTTAVALLNPTAGTIGDPTDAVVTNQDSANSVWLGGSAVTTSSTNVGYELKAGVTLRIGAAAGDVLWAISNGSVRVDVLKGRQ